MNTASSVLVPARKPAGRTLWLSTLARRASGAGRRLGELSPVAAGVAILLIFGSSSLGVIAGLVVGAGGLARLSFRAGEGSAPSGDQS